MSGDAAILDLRLLQVGLLCLRPRSADPERLADVLRQRLAEAPELLAGAAVLLDFERMPGLAGDAARSIAQTAREAGLKPVGLTDGEGGRRLAAELDLALIAAPSARPRGRAEPAPTGSESGVRAETSTSRIVEGMVRSGQQIYAPGGDLVVLGSVGAGAELVADGHVHVYGSLRGRALAGARGDASARVFCLDFRAELVAIAGHYRLFDDEQRRLDGGPVQCRLDGEALRVERIGH